MQCRVHRTGYDRHGKHIIPGMKEPDVTQYRAERQARQAHHMKEPGVTQYSAKRVQEATLLLRGTLVNRTYGVHKNLYI